MTNDLCLVAASSGLDSTLTLSILKLAGYKNIISCHFSYGHRGGDAEKLAITKICSLLDVPLKIFDLTSIYKEIDKESMLTNPLTKITTGTEEGLKQLDAWVSGRNMIFLSVMGALAEAETIKNNYSKIYLLGGFLSLTESGHYPDNSEYFLQTFLEHAKYGTLIGNRLEPLYCLSNLMKSELFVLIKYFHLENIYSETISCDRPIVKDGKSYNCSKEGIPACGSGLLSYWGAKISGVEDKRRFYEVNDPEYKAYIPDHLKEGFVRCSDINNIINRILLPEDKLENLRKNLDLI
jgi:7-cyano-7-deazaguanine synthase in queuosine biosynthesis